MKQIKPIVTNRQALRDYYIDKAYEAGIQLKGSEVKSLRDGKANLKGSFAKFENDELYLHNVHISSYSYSREESDPLRCRKLLLQRTELRQLIAKVQQKGYTLVPLKVYFKRGYAKVEIGLARGKKLYDKRRALKEKEVKREMQKFMSS